MWTTFPCLTCLLLTPFLCGFQGQSLVFQPLDESQIASECPHPGVVMEGERVVLTALLNTSMVSNSSSLWPLDKIELKQLGNREITICQLNLTRDGCPGPVSEACGYCLFSRGSLYHLVFNWTASLLDTTNPGFSCVWEGASSSIVSFTSFYIMGRHASISTSLGVMAEYETHDLGRYHFELTNKSDYVVVAVHRLALPGTVSWRYSYQDIPRTLAGTEVLQLEVSEWDDHLGEDILLDYLDVCGRTWSFTIPVIDRPAAVCDPPVISRSPTDGTQVRTECRSRTFQDPPEFHCCLEDLDMDFCSTSVTRDKWTCTINVTDDQWSAGDRTLLWTHWYLVADVQFTNGTYMLPRISSFTVNGSESVIVDPGSDVTLECRVYGHPATTAMVEGPNTDKFVRERSQSGRLTLTLLDIQCQDMGRYTCTGVNQVGSTPKELRAHVHVIVKCPPKLRSSTQGSNNWRFQSRASQDVLVTLEVYGFPAPGHFLLHQLRVQPRSSVQEPWSSSQQGAPSSLSQRAAGFTLEETRSSSFQEKSGFPSEEARDPSRQEADALSFHATSGSQNTEIQDSSFHRKQSSSLTWEQKSTALVELLVDPDHYTVTYTALNPTLGLLNLVLHSDVGEGVYLLSVSNGAIEDLKFQFEVEEVDWNGS